MSALDDDNDVYLFSMLEWANYDDDVKFTHALQVINYEPVVNSRQPDVDLKVVSIVDDMDEDYLSKFDDIFAFIDNALATKGNKIALFCWAGISRSGTIALLYLMRKHGCSFSEANRFLVSRQIEVCPNDSFQLQAYLYYQHGYHLSEAERTRWQERVRMMNVSRDSTTYRKSIWKEAADFLATQGEKWQKDYAVCLRHLGIISEARRKHLQSPGKRIVSSLKCAKCRQVIVKKESLHPGHDASEPCRDFYLTEVPHWLRNDASNHDAMVEQNEGKLHCPKCAAKLGNYCWSGASCSCGEWIAPSFHLIGSKVDPVHEDV